MKQRLAAVAWTSLVSLAALWVTAGAFVLARPSFGLNSQKHGRCWRPLLRSTNAPEDESVEERQPQQQQPPPPKQNSISSKLADAAAALRRGRGGGASSSSADDAPFVDAGAFASASDADAAIGGGVGVADEALDGAMELESLDSDGKPSRVANLTASLLVMRIAGGGRLGDLRAQGAATLTNLTAEGKVRFANFTNTSTEIFGNFTALNSMRLGNFTSALGGRRIVDFASKLKVPQMPNRLRKARIGLQAALDDLGLDAEDRLGTVLARLRRLQAQQEARERESELSMTLEEGRVLPVTDLSPPERRIWIVTTASLPWMTGTSVNPLLRAAYLARGRAAGVVSIMMPFVQLEDQERLFPAGQRFATPAEQTEYLRQWLRNAGMTAEAALVEIVWYPGRYLEKMGCIFPMGDITRLIPDAEADVCIMEEPEHINWYRATGTNWSKKFKHVVGIIHTNYVYYAAQDRLNWGAQIKGPWVRGFNKLMARAYCDKVIKLSATLQKFAEEKETVCNVHGVRERFLEVGDATAAALAEGRGLDGGAYMLGKMLWEKGYDRLWELMAASSARLGACFPVDVYGSGPEQGDIRDRAELLGLPVAFHPATDHATLAQYRLFVNPSVSEVLCTTIAEALAMGKWVVCARHPSNEFFYQFPNCLPFTGEKEFSANVWRAMTMDPAPLSKEQRETLSWEAATQRLIEAAKVTVGESKARRRELDEIAWVFHQNLGEGRRGDTVRKILQAGIVSEQNAFTATFADLRAGLMGGGGGGDLETAEQGAVTAAAAADAAAATQASPTSS